MVYRPIAVGVAYTRGGHVGGHVRACVGVSYSRVAGEKVNFCAVVGHSTIAFITIQAKRKRAE